MPLGASTKPINFDLKLVTASHPKGAEHALQNGNWWTFSSKTGWIVSDVGSSTSPITSFSLKSTNPTAAVKAFKLEALVQSKIQGAPSYGSVADSEFVSSHNEAWQTILEERVDKVPNPAEYNFPPVVAQFWKVSFLENFGATWYGINRIMLSGSTAVISAVIHGGVHDQHRSIICDGVSKVYRSGGPGTLALFGADAFPIFGAKANDGKCDGLDSVGCAAACIAPAGGKVVAFTHNGYMNGPGFTTKPVEKDEDRQFVKLLAQTLKWCGNMKNGSTTTISIAFLGGYKNSHIDPLKQHMSEHGVNIQSVFSGASILEGDIVKACNSGAQVIFLYCNNGKNLICGFDNPKVHALRSFILRGGAFITGLCPWGWLQVSGGSGDLRTNCLSNHVLSIGGMVYTSNYLGGNGCPYVTPTKCPTMQGNNNQCQCHSAHLGDAVLALREAQRVNGSVSAASLKTLCSDLSQLSASIHTNIALDLQQGGRRMPHEIDDGSFAFCSLINQTICGKSGQYPSVQFPANCGEGEAIKAEEAVQSVSISLNQTLWLASSPTSCTRAPGIDFPGCVETHCSRASNSIINVSVGTAGWQSTGLYIPPGDCCTIELHNDENSASLPMTPHFRIRIGCHTDRLNDKSSLSRWPEISISAPWDPSVCEATTCQTSLCTPRSGCQTQIASPFGGLLYLEVDNWQKYGVEHKSVYVKVIVNGAVKAPWFALDREDGIGYTNEERDNQRLVLRFPRSTPSLSGYDHADWESRVNQSGAPWGELEGNFVILTLPRECLKFVKDPVAVLKYWDTVVSNECRLAHQTLNRKERLVCDRQISAGYMHSGYPVMCQMDICTSKNGGIPRVVSLDVLNKDGSWGVYHEFGHNRQCSAWTFEGTGEVTVNIFSLYSCYKILRQMPYETDWFKGSAMNSCAKYIEESSMTFQNSWQQSPAIALGTYASFIQRYGFEVISDIFLIYEQMENGDKPKTDKEKITEWVKQTSVAVQKDLRPYYRQWKWPFDNEKLNDILNAFPEDNWSTLVADLKSS